MTKNTYYRQVYGRINMSQVFLNNFFFKCSGYPRMMLEVFIRKDFGERYFSWSKSLWATFLLLVGPLFYHLNQWGATWGGFFSQFTTWYLYTAVFTYACYRHRQSVKHTPGVFDFARFSLSSGKTLPVFKTIQLPTWLSKDKTSIRRVETLFEPLAFFIPGLLLYTGRQPLGLLLMVCAVIYAMSYVLAYKAGDIFVMNKIDEMICNEELKKTFVDGMDQEGGRGFTLRSRRPVDAERRQELLPTMLPDEKEVFEAR